MPTYSHSRLSTFEQCNLKFKFKYIDKVEPEVEVIEKVFDFITNTLPGEFEKASKEFKKGHEAKFAKDEYTYSRGILAWFLLQRPTKTGLTPMELAHSFPLDFFTKQDRKIMRNFINHVDSLFEVDKVDGKDFLLKNTVGGKMYLVRTINFPNLLEKDDVIRALIVKKLGGDYFFYGNVWTYSPENRLKMKRYFLANAREIGKRQVPKVDWEIEYAKNA